MLRQIAIASLFTLGSAFTLIHPTQAQTTNPEINNLLRQANQAVSESNSFMNNVARPEAQQYQNYLNSLRQLCFRGNSAACQEHNARMSAQLRWQNQVQAQYNYYLNNQR
jgi:hypothetical protein